MYSFCELAVMVCELMVRAGGLVTDGRMGEVWESMRVCSLTAAGVRIVASRTGEVVMIGDPCAFVVESMIAGMLFMLVMKLPSAFLELVVIGREAVMSAVDRMFEMLVWPWALTSVMGIEMRATVPVKRLVPLSSSFEPIIAGLE